MNPEMMAALKNLVLLDLAAVEAYQVASSACSRGELKDQLASFEAEHARHARELSGWMRANGEEPPQGLDDTGRVIKRYTELSALEDRGAILAMRGNEELTNNAYYSALRGELELPEDLKSLVEGNFEDERRHINWIRQTIIALGWDREPEELREVIQRAA